MVKSRLVVGLRELFFLCLLLENYTIFSGNLSLFWYKLANIRSDRFLIICFVLDVSVYDTVQAVFRVHLNQPACH